MVKVSETYAGAFVTGAELHPLGQRRAAVIHTAVQEIVGQESTAPRIVLDLVSKQGQPWPRRVVLNKTNALHLAAAFGDDTDAWAGRGIEIWAEMVMFKGKATPGIKLSSAPSQAAATQSLPPPPTPPQAHPTPKGGSNWAGNGSELDDEIPF